MKKFSIRDLCLTALFTAITAVMSQIAIPIPFSPIPISLGTLAVYTCGIFLAPKYALLSQLCYLLIGSAGLPVFVGFRGGISALFGPTGGYLLTYPIVALIISLATNYISSHTKHIASIFIICGISICTATLVLYIAGTAWLSFSTHTSFISALSLGVFPYIPMDIVKMLVSVFALIPLRRRFINMGLINQAREN